MRSRYSVGWKSRRWWRKREVSVGEGEVAEELEGFERDGRLELGVAEGLEEAEAGGLFLFVEDFGAGEGGLVVLVVLVVLVLVLVLLF
jgi:hypothetical protein